jgi:hypothetical protein
LYFAGHGCSYRGRYVFCPEDFRIEIPDLTGIGIDVLLDVISRFNASAELVVLILDTCRGPLDDETEESERPDDNCTLIFTCRFGDCVIDIEGQSDFVKGFGAFSAAVSYPGNSDLASNRFGDLLDFLDGRKLRDGTGTPISIDMKGAGARRVSFISRARANGARHSGPKQVRVASLIKPMSSCNKLNGEILHKISNILGVPPDPKISEVVEAGLDLARIQLTLSVMQPLKVAGVLEYIIFQFPGLFGSAAIVYPQGLNLRLAADVFESAEFQVWSEGPDTWFASRKIGPVVAKVEIRRFDNGESHVEMKCFGEWENEGWGLDRYDTLLADLLRALMRISG